MNYELAKELKDAGFPWQFGFNCIRDDEEHGFCRADKPDCKMRVLSIPALEQLIEACGDRFNSLESPFSEEQIEITNESAGEKLEWCAIATNSDIDGDMAFGKTPQEAVAKLWLALNKK